METQVDTEAAAAPSLHLYISLHLTLMLGYAKAGATPLDPLPASPETKETDTTDYVQCPLDILLSYHYRMVDRAHKLPYFKAVPWIQAKDEADRAEWIERMRRSALPLGKIVKQVYEARAALWEIPDEKAAPPPPAPADRPVKRPRGAPSGEKGGKDNKRLRDKADSAEPQVINTNHKTTDLMKDGSKICRDWNKGGCKEPCVHGFKHVCNALIKNRACGMRNHRSIHCRNAVQ